MGKSQSTLKLAVTMMICGGAFSLEDRAAEFFPRWTPRAEIPTCLGNHVPDVGYVIRKHGFNSMVV